MYVVCQTKHEYDNKPGSKQEKTKQKCHMIISTDQQNPKIAVQFTFRTQSSIKFMKTMTS